MNYATPEAMRAAREIVDSDRVLRVFAAPAWDELSDDGKMWISAIVDEAKARVNPLPVPLPIPSTRKRAKLNWLSAPVDEGEAPLEPMPAAPVRIVCAGNLKASPFGLTPHFVARVLAVADYIKPVPAPTADNGSDAEPVRVAPCEESSPVGNPPCPVGEDNTGGRA